MMCMFNLSCNLAAFASLVVLILNSDVIIVRVHDSVDVS